MQNIAFILIGLGILALIGWGVQGFFMASDIPLLVRIAAVQHFNDNAECSRGACLRDWGGARVDINDVLADNGHSLAAMPLTSMSGGSVGTGRRA